MLNDYIGIPFKDMGRDPVKDGGLDCWGLVRYYYLNELGIELPEYRISSLYDLDINRLADNEIKAKGMFEIADKPFENCIVMMKLGSRFVNHAGVLINNKILHTYQDINSCLVAHNNPLWSRIIAYYLRFKK